MERREIGDDLIRLFNAFEGVIERLVYFLNYSFPQLQVCACLCVCVQAAVLDGDDVLCAYMLCVCARARVCVCRFWTCCVCLPVLNLCCFRMALPPPSPRSSFPSFGPVLGLPNHRLDGARTDDCLDPGRLLPPPIKDGSQGKDCRRRRRAAVD